jgi:hypothetical protein
VAYNPTHGLKKNRIRFIAIINHKKMPREGGLVVRDPSLVI